MAYAPRHVDVNVHVAMIQPLSDSHDDSDDGFRETRASHPGNDDDAATDATFCVSD